MAVATQSAGSRTSIRRRALGRWITPTSPSLTQAKAVTMAAQQKYQEMLAAGESPMGPGGGMGTSGTNS